MVKILLITPTWNSLRRLGSHCVGRLCRLVRAASPLGRSMWRLRNKTQLFLRVCWVSLPCGQPPPASTFYSTYNFLRVSVPLRGSKLRGASPRVAGRSPTNPYFDSAKSHFIYYSLKHFPRFFPAAYTVQSGMS